MGTLRRTIMLINVLWMVTSLFIGYSHEQVTGADILGGVFPSPQASPLVSQRQSRIPSQQVIVPGGFQHHQIFGNQFPNLRGLDNGNSRLAQSPISIQNQQFAFLPRDPFGRAVTNAGSRSPSSSITSAKPTSSRSLSPNFVEIVSPNPQRLVSGTNRGNIVSGGGIGGNSQLQSGSSLLSQPLGNTAGLNLKSNNPGLNLKNVPSDVQYEYYDETDGDLLYQYGNDFNDPSINPHPSPNRPTGQFFAEVSPSQKPKSSGIPRNPTPTITTSSTSKKTSKPTLSSSIAGLPEIPNKPAPTGTSGSSSGRLYRPSNRPSIFSSSASGSGSRETSSSFIPLIDESEEPEQGLALNGRSVHSTSHRGNTLPGRQAFLNNLRATTAPPSPSSESNSSSSSSGQKQKPEKSRTRGVYTRTQVKSSAERNSTSGTGSRRAVQGLLRGASGNLSTGNSRLTSRTPIIIRPRNLTRSKAGQSNNKKEDGLTSSSTYRPDSNFDGLGSGSSENPNAQNSLPSVEDYTVEYIEYPFNNEDNSSIVEYYEVSEETAQALLQRAKAKASNTHNPGITKLNKNTNNGNNNSNSNETATKVTVSVSSKSSYSSTSTTTSSTTTTPSPAQSAENSSDQINPSGEVVVSVATTKSVSGKKGNRGDVTESPQQRFSSTSTPRVSVSSSVQSSSRSVGKGKHHQNQNHSSKIHSDSMPSGAETAPEYYEEEYTYPDNYPVLNNEAPLRPQDQRRGSSKNGNDRGVVVDDEDDDVEEKQTNANHFGQNEYSHEVSIQQPPAISPTKSTNKFEIPKSVSSVSVSHNYRESSESSVALQNNNNDENSQNYDDDDEEDSPLSPPQQARKLPSKKGEIILPNHFETLVDDMSELEMDHPLRNVNQGDLNQQPNDDDEASYHVHIMPSTSIPTLTTTTATSTTPPPPPSSSTTEKLKKDPVNILSSIRFAEVSPDFLPPGFKFPSAPSPQSPSVIPSTSSETSSSSSTTTTSTTEATPAKGAFGIQFQEINLSALLPKGYKPRPSLPKSPTTTTTTEKPSVAATAGTKPVDPLEALKNLVKFQEIAIPGLVPKDYSPDGKKDNSNNASSSVFAGIKFETPANLLPPGFKPPATSSQPVGSIRFETPANLLPKGYKPPSSETVDPIKFEFPANLLPPGYKPPSSSSEKVPPSSTEALPSPSTTKKPGGVVFPTKPGGVRVTRPTTTEPPKGDTPPPPAVRIATGWPTRKTTAFTGWPTPPTTPMPSTSSTTTTTTTPPSTTTTATTTTTTPPPKRSPLGTCPEGICRLEATIRIVGGVKWMPELHDVNTDEYKNLETTVKRELDGAYRSSGLAPWYRKVEIEGFNRGSVIVDYFLLLDGIDRDLSTDSVVRQFHKSLLDSADELPYYDENDSPDQLVSNGRLRFGRYTIDPRYTDFKVVNITKDSGPLAQDPLIPQWGIAVIVIGLASLLFVIIFGVTVLVNRHKNSKKKNAVSLTQEMLSEFNKSHMSSGAGGLDNYGADDLYNMDDVWNDRMDKTFDRKPTKRSQGSGKGSANYNIYDSWKTEWNGYYYNGNYYGDSGYAPSRRRSDYDTNF